MCLSRDLLIVICLSDSPVSTLACVLTDSVFGSPLGLTFRYSDLGCPCDYDFCLVPIKPCFFTFTVHLGPPWQTIESSPNSVTNGLVISQTQHWRLNRFSISTHIFDQTLIWMPYQPHGSNKLFPSRKHCLPPSKPLLYCWNSHTCLHHFHATTVTLFYFHIYQNP